MRIPTGHLRCTSCGARNLAAGEDCQCPSEARIVLEFLSVPVAVLLICLVGWLT